MKIYTKTGDAGETSLFGGRRVAKTSKRIEAYGTVDELNASLGVVAAACTDEEMLALLRELQKDCFVVGADLATPLNDPHTVQRVTAEDVTRLERHIDELDAELAPLTHFILPRGTPCAAALHLARTICRRAERRVCEMEQEGSINPDTRIYLNRLSDLLFVMARVVNLRAGKDETIWEA
ncbi:MAG: cob(I)yrinic acid a,c-diamide adenosyltransferase [Candidatus Kerfeldbacteria bacterium]|nr:cob(I)yrinic acid a,c-diamide adenosyltransferase [Candidatus Kerfeldbacteria bacterium]